MDLVGYFYLCSTYMINPKITPHEITASKIIVPIYEQLGYEFLPIVVVVPFLILAIGVDDVFIFLHCWAQSDPERPLRERVSEMLENAGPSVT